jgi:hypothetical protein
MARSPEDIAQAAEAAADYIENLTDEDVEFRPAIDLRTLGFAANAVAGAEATLAGCVAMAREAGRTWGEIGMALGVTGEAAAERYG